MVQSGSSSLPAVREEARCYLSSSLQIIAFGGFLFARTTAFPCVQLYVCIMYAHNRRDGDYTTHVAATYEVEKRDTSRLGSIRLRGSERRDWSRDGCIVSCLRCSADWLHPGSVDCTLRFRRVSNRAISNPVLFLCRVSFFFLLPPPPCCSSVSTLEPPFFFIFPTPFSLLSLEHPAAIDRQKSHGGIS